MRYEFEIDPEFEVDLQQETDYELLPEFETITQTNNKAYIQWIQSSLNSILNAHLSVDGIMGPLTKNAVRIFQQRQGLVVDGIPGPKTKAAIDIALKSPQGPVTPGVPPLPPGLNWSASTLEQRVMYIMDRLVKQYLLPVNGASGLVGNLIAESYLIPNRVEGSRPSTPMRAKNFSNVQTDFSPLEIMNRNFQTKTGPSSPGVGLAQWTSANRRSRLFNYTFQGRQLKESILFNMDAQLEYLINEMRNQYSKVYAILSRPGVSINEASDYVVYNFEIPGSVLSTEKPRKRLPVNDPRVQSVFVQRRQYSQKAYQIYVSNAGKSNPSGTSPQTVPAPSYPSIGPSGGSLRTNMIQIALQEWNKWGQGSKKENDPSLQAVLKNYWVFGTGSDKGYTGKGPWSAAFISWVVKKSGGGTNFRYSGAHATYTYAAKVNREQNKLSPFKAYRITEKRPEPGDIIVKNRDGSKYTYENIKPGSGTHGDIVVKVNSNNIEVIGGNVNNSVSKRSIAISPDGFLNSPLHFAIIKIEATI